MRRSFRAPSAFVASPASPRPGDAALLPACAAALPKKPATATSSTRLSTAMPPINPHRWRMQMQMQMQPELPPTIASPSYLGPAQLASSLSTILLTATLLRMLGLRSQSSRILSAAARMSVQLAIMGAFVLAPLFAYASSSPWKIAAWIALVAVLASREATARCSKHAYDGQFFDCFAAISGGVGLTLVHMVAFVLRRPSFSRATISVNAQMVIPLAGMLFGNALSATTLGMSVLLRNLSESVGRGRVELRLSRGADVWEAALPAVREAVEAALMPTVNAMASTGLIFMPGMMTGQILGGQSPSAAAAYQIMIYFAIAASSCSTAILLAGIVTARMFDLRHQALVPWRSVPGLRESERSGSEDLDGPKPSKLRFLEKPSSLKVTTEQPLLRVQQLTVESTDLEVPLLDVNVGDRIGISGRSGIGKTKLLRALARLDPPSNARESIGGGGSNAVSLEGESWDDISPAEWRSRVMWVSQDRPTVSGTPRELYSQILNYRSHRQLNEYKKERSKQLQCAPMEVAQRWNIHPQTWDRPWGEISGGEAQRLSLAIALALEPRVLLLDEPTSSCDAAATSKIEMTLIEKECDCCHGVSQ